MVDDDYYLELGKKQYKALLDSFKDIQEETEKKAAEIYNREFNTSFGLAGVKAEGTTICRFCLQPIKECYCNG